MKTTGKQRSPYRSLFRDIFLVALSIFVSAWIVRIGVLDSVVAAVSEIKLLATFIGGFFFTSAFTIAPAAIVLASLAHQVSPLWLSFWGALGALCGDLVIFLFVRDRFAEDIVDVLKLAKAKKLLHFFHKGYFRWLSPVLGALIIASPLPDEIGITMMGLSKTKTSLLIPISFVMNFIAIWIISQIALGVF